METHCPNCSFLSSEPSSSCLGEEPAVTNGALVNALNDKYLEIVKEVQMLEDGMRMLDEREPLTLNESQRLLNRANELDDKRLLLIALRNSLFATLTLLKITK